MPHDINPHNLARTLMALALGMLPFNGACQPTMATPNGAKSVAANRTPQLALWRVSGSRSSTQTPFPVLHSAPVIRIGKNVALAWAPVEDLSDSCGDSYVQHRFSSAWKLGKQEGAVTVLASERCPDDLHNDMAPNDSFYRVTALDTPVARTNGHINGNWNTYPEKSCTGDHGKVVASVRIGMVSTAMLDLLNDHLGSGVEPDYSHDVMELLGSGGEKNSSGVRILFFEPGDGDGDCGLSSVAIADVRDPALDPNLLFPEAIYQSVSRDGNPMRATTTQSPQITTMEALMEKKDLRRESISGEALALVDVQSTSLGWLLGPTRTVQGVAVLRRNRDSPFVPDLASATATPALSIPLPKEFFQGIYAAQQCALNVESHISRFNQRLRSTRTSAPELENDLRGRVAAWTECTLDGIQFSESTVLSSKFLEVWARRETPAGSKD